MKFRYIFSIVVLLLISHKLLAQKKVNQANLVKLVTSFVGNYSNQKQVKADSSYQMVYLKVNSVIVPNNPNQWLLFELTTKSHQFDSCQNYLFQIFELNDSVIVFQPYEFPMAAKNNWNYKTNFNNLQSKAGCAIFLKKDYNQTLKGQTLSIDCKTNFIQNGFQSFYINLNYNEINWWNTIYDSLGNQIWGNTKGGYIFNKINKQNN